MCCRFARFALFGLVAATPVRAADDQGQLWLNWQAGWPIRGRLLGHFDTSSRIGTSTGRLEQFLVRAGLGWRASPTVTLQAGWFYSSVWPDPGREQREHRGHQQVVLQLAAGQGWSLQARTRIEERFNLDRDGLSIRFRQQARLNVDLGLPRGVRPFLAPEVLVTVVAADAWGPRRGVDQARQVVGVAVPLARTQTLEVSYMTIWFPQSDRLTHIPQIQLVSRF